MNLKALPVYLGDAFFYGLGELSTLYILAYKPNSKYYGKCQNGYARKHSSGFMRVD